MRIGTWNLDARWTDRHAAVLADADCDVWLLTEAVGEAVLPGYRTHLCEARMSRGQRYAGVMSRFAMDALPDPHPASAAVRIDGLTFCSSVLPWADADNPLVWGEGNQGTRTTSATRVLATSLHRAQSVWGGDFNHALDGPTRWSGSTAGRQAIKELAASIEITVPTSPLPHRLPGICTIDHIGVPKTWRISGVARIEVAAALSDHDAYVATAYRA